MNVYSQRNHSRKMTPKGASKPIILANHTTTPPTRFKNSTGQKNVYLDALVELSSIYGANNMADRLDDVIFTYTDSMLGRGDAHTSETINCLRTIRDAFRTDGLKRVKYGSTKNNRNRRTHI